MKTGNLEIEHLDLMQSVDISNRLLAKALYLAINSDDENMYLNAFCKSIYRRVLKHGRSGSVKLFPPVMSNIDYGNNFDSMSKKESIKILKMSKKKALKYILNAVEKGIREYKK